MEILTNTNNEFANAFYKKMQSYAHYYWLVAFATTGNDVDTKIFRKIYTYLLEHKERIAQFYIGGMNNITDPVLLSDLHDCPNVAFYISYEKTALGKIKLNDKVGIHSKCYWFYNNDSDWCVFIGSANFTEAGFTGNVEVMTQISSVDNDAKTILCSLKDLFRDFPKQYANTCKLTRADNDALQAYIKKRKISNLIDKTKEDDTGEE